MLISLLEYLIYLLATYGFVVLILGAVELIGCRAPAHRPDIRVVLLVKDAEEHIEYIIRNAVKRDFVTKVFSDKNMVVIDMNSGDHTYQLLEKLQNDFSNIEALTFEERELIFDDFSTFSHSKN